MSDLTSTKNAFRVGDVLRYTPQPRFQGQADTRWCREGTALATERRDGSTLILDTYWGSMSDAHVLTDAELATAELIFNVGDYDELDQYRSGSREQWLRYAPEDRQRITSQHGLQCRWFIRKDASESLATQIENAREAVRDAEGKVESAQWRLDWAKRDLAELEAKVGAR